MVSININTLAALTSWINVWIAASPLWVHNRTSAKSLFPAAHEQRGESFLDFLWWIVSDVLK